MKHFVLFMIAIVLFILDTSFMPYMSFKNFYPSLLTLYFFIYCLNNEKYSITFFALYIGLIQDIFFNNSFGLNIFLNLSIGLILLCLSNKFNKDKYILSIFVVTVVSVFKSFVIVIYVFIFLKINANIIGMFYEFIYTFVMLIIIYPIFNAMFKSRLFKKTLEF